MKHETTVVKRKMQMDSMPKKRNSKRRYPPMKCKHCDMIFVPTDGKQKFLNPQHRQDYFNDLRKIKLAPLKSLTDRILVNERILKKIYEAQIRLGQKMFFRDLLMYEGFDFETYSGETINSTTGNRVFWCFSFGLEGHKDLNNNFIIHKK